MAILSRPFRQEIIQMAQDAISTASTAAGSASGSRAGKSPTSCKPLIEQQLFCHHDQDLSIEQHSWAERIPSRNQPVSTVRSQHHYGINTGSIRMKSVLIPYLSRIDHGGQSGNVPGEVGAATLSLNLIAASNASHRRVVEKTCLARPKMDRNTQHPPAPKNGGRMPIWH